MARQIYSFAVTVPAGTAKLTPVTVPITTPVRTVTEIEVVIPPGPAGQMGFMVAMSGVPVIPYNSGEWIIGDDDKINWPLDDFPDSGDWSVVAYNTGVYDHTVYFRLLTEIPVDPIGNAPQIISNADLSVMAGA
jgi:hypothetical protein